MLDIWKFQDAWKHRAGSTGALAAHIVSPRQLWHKMIHGNAWIWFVADFAQTGVSMINKNGAQDRIQLWSDAQ